MDDASAITRQPAAGGDDPETVLVFEAVPGLEPAADGASPATDDAGGALAAAAPADAPRVRWAGILWGAVLAIAAALTIWILLAADRREAFTDWVVSSPWMLLGVTVLAIGAIVLLAGLTALIRRGERRRRTVG